MKGKVIIMKLCRVFVFSLAVILVARCVCAEDAVRIGILRFDVKANGVSHHDAEAITDELTRMLTNSRSIAIIDRYSLEAIAREHRLSLSGLVDPRTAAELGKLAGIRYLIRGAVTHFTVNEDVKHSDSRPLMNQIADKNKSWGDFLRSLGNETIEVTKKAEVTLDMRVIDVNTAEVMLAMSETGTSVRSFSASSSRSGGNQTTQNATLQNEAISSAVSRLGLRIKEAIAEEYTQVLSANGGDIIISIGATSGVRAGNLYKISSEGEEILDMRGNVIGRRPSAVAVVSVSEVQNDFSVARVLKKGGNPSLIQRGDRAEPISQQEASDMIRNKVFITSRPKKHLGQSAISGAELDRRLNTIAEDQKREPINSKQEQQVHENTQQAGNVGASFVVDNDISIRRSNSLKLENFSTNAGKVIASYGLAGDEENSLKEQHKQAEKMLSNDGKSDRYKGIFRQYPFDYLAAYQAAKIAFDIGHYSEAKEWAEKSLSVNPKYSPAKKLSKATSSNM